MAEPVDRPTKMRKLTHSSSAEALSQSNLEKPVESENGPGQSSDLPEINSLLPTEPCTAKDQIAGEGYDDQNSVKSSPPDANEVSGLSKNALRKLRKRQQWEAGREDRKLKRKEKRHAKQARKREEPKTKDADSAPEVKQPQAPAVSVPMTFIIDVAFDSMMMENEITSLSSQISRCYNAVRNACVRPQLAVSSFNGRLRTRFDTVLDGQYKNWKGVHILEESVQEVAEQAQTWMKSINPDVGDDQETNEAGLAGSTKPRESAHPHSPSLVYLSAESETVLTELSPYTSYVIGGLIDKNRYKGHCFNVAQEAGIATARLPIEEYIKLSTRKVLTTNHVVEILLKYLETNDWARSFLAVIPARKGADMKDHGNGTELDDPDGKGDNAEPDSIEAKLNLQNRPQQI